MTVETEIARKRAAKRWTPWPIGIGGLGAIAYPWLPHWVSLLVFYVLMTAFIILFEHFVYGLTVYRMLGDRLATDRGRQRGNLWIGAVGLGCVVSWWWTGFKLEAEHSSPPAVYVANIMVTVLAGGFHNCAFCHKPKFLPRSKSPVSESERELAEAFCAEFGWPLLEQPMESARITSAPPRAFFVLWTFLMLGGMGAFMYGAEGLVGALPIWVAAVYFPVSLFRSSKRR